jgi:hypothetical protein
LKKLNSNLPDAPEKVSKANMLFAVKNATSSMNPSALFAAEKNSQQSIKLLLLIVKFTRINNIHLYQIM